AATDPARLAAELADLDPDLGVATRAALSSPAGWPPAGWPVPNQLPAVAGYFTGRDEELARLLHLPTTRGRWWSPPPLGWPGSGRPHWSCWPRTGSPRPAGTRTARCSWTCTATAGGFPPIRPTRWRRCCGGWVCPARRSLPTLTPGSGCTAACWPSGG